MAGLFSLEEGKELVRLARKSIEYYSATGSLLRENAVNDKFAKECGVFVTAKGFPGRELRGCIGFPYAIKPLWDSIIQVAVEAGFHDPRFPPLMAEELEKIVIEISVLTKPEEITGEKKEILEKIKIGRDGLIVQKSGRSGLLLPQVAVDEKWNPEEFVRYCCRKASLPESAWQSRETKIFKFQAQIFHEKTPNGNIAEEKN
ncbi:MAG: TIGR00296 family protein [Candidatus ainarchaeum sp.]|nr:TIGR00296 family protein [Candidatus ainarchaeum sp.]